MVKKEKTLTGQAITEVRVNNKDLLIVADDGAWYHVDIKEFAKLLDDTIKITIHKKKGLMHATFEHEEHEKFESQ